MITGEAIDFCERLIAKELRKELVEKGIVETDQGDEPLMFDELLSWIKC